MIPPTVDTESVFIGVIFSEVSGRGIGHGIDFPNTYNHKQASPVAEGKVRGSQ